MQNNPTEQTTTTTAQVTEVNEENKGATEKEVSLGKFKDISALLSAYNSLESEFTKRCQKIKELEEKVKMVDKENSTRENAPKDNSPIIESQEDKTIKSITKEEKEEIVKGYLKEILSSKSSAIVLDEIGTGVKSPTNKPKTIEQAGELAKEFLNTKL